MKQNQRFCQPHSNTVRLRHNWPHTVGVPPISKKRKLTINKTAGENGGHPYFIRLFLQNEVINAYDIKDDFQFVGISN